jgi:serine/threonine-protein kinase HipA
MSKTKNTQKYKCLYCYENISSTEYEYHIKCSLRLFGTRNPPILPYDLDMIDDLASEEINKRISVTGVQPKLSLELEKKDRTTRLTIVGLWGGYIFKPPFALYPEMPEIEDLTMHLAEIAGIITAEHSLIRLRSGELGYITKRFDRDWKGDGNEKIPTEDLCQLTETLTINKYNSSMEKIGRTIQKFSDYSGNDKLRLFELTLFCFLTGNADMHLKNFSMYKNIAGEWTLSPAYDLIASKLLITNDPEESALTINGKKKNIRKKDLDGLALNLQIDQKVRNFIYEKMRSNIDPMIDFLNKGFLSEKTLENYRKLILKNAKQISLI